MTTDDKMILYFFEKIKDQSISEENRLRYLLNLLPSKINKTIYTNRYETNSQLVKGFIFDELIDHINRLRPIRISECSDELKIAVMENYKKFSQNSEISNKKK